MKTDYQWCFENSEEAAELICSQSKRIEDLEASQEECKKLAEQMNVISELLVGCREGSYAEIIQAIAHFKTKAYKHEMNEKVEQLYSLIDDLADTKADIIEGA